MTRPGKCRVELHERRKKTMTVSDLIALLPLLTVAVTIVVILLVVAFHRSHRLTVTLTLEAATSPHAPRLLSSMRSTARDSAIRECAALVHETLPGFDYTREIELTHELSLGDTLLMYEGDMLAGFALCHSAPLVEGRTREELRVLKAVVRDERTFDDILVQLADLARRTATARVAIRLQGDYASLYRRLVGLGARVRWTDLRMVLAGYEERPPKFGIALSNWEI